MKKLLLIALIACLAEAGMWTRFQGWVAETRKPDAMYAVDTIGENVRVYEFTSKSQPNIICIVLFTESETKSPVMTCVKK